MSERENDDVALKVLHTADWHLGKPFARFDESDRLKLTRARLDVIDSILDVAETNMVDAVLCAGDLFDEPQPSEMWWRGLADKLAKRSWSSRPVVLLPGNHDPMTDTSVYSPNHPFRTLLPDWVHVVDRDDFELALGDDAIVLARPCRSQAGDDDNALQLPARQPGDDRIRIGLVHGSTFDMEGHQTNFPISRDAAAQRGLDYLAIGDTHAWREYPPAHAPTVYPSAPEQTSFAEKDTGFVALVFFRRHSRRPRIRQEHVARWRWRSEVIRSLDALRALVADATLRTTVLELTFDLHVSPMDYDEAERLVDELKGNEAKHGRAGVLVVDRDGLVLDTADIESVFAELPSVLQATARALKAAEATDPEVARRALIHLYRLGRDVGGAS
jgi:DNA repair exonuclease SbcCD nuclease subunit